jgi:hypothetical protein
MRNRPENSAHRGRPPPAVDYYFVRAAALRLAIESNRQDAAFANTGGRITYLMDANVVRFFLDPVSERGRLESFGPGHYDYASSTALVTAEFLFSRGLAGQGDMPALIAPAHGEEVRRIAHALATKASEGLSSEGTLTSERRAQLEALVDETRSGSLQLDIATDRLREIVPEVAGELLERVLPANQLVRLHDEGLLMALALHPAATREVLTSGGDVRERKATWTKYILAEKHRGNSSRGTASAGDERKLAESDAEVLVQLELLQADFDPDKVRYVLVTADETLFDAYAHHYSRQPLTERGHFAVRRLLQYVPIINVSEMPNEIESSDLITKAEKALDQVLAGYREAGRRNYPNSLMMARVLAREGSALADHLKELYGYNPLSVRPSDREHLEKVSHIWREGFRSSVVLNAQLMARRLETGMKPVADLLREQTGLRDALHSVTRRLMERVERAHRQLNNNVELDLIAGQGALAGRALPEGRLKTWIMPGQSEILSGLTFPEVFSRLSKGDRDLLGRIKQNLDGAGYVDSCLFASCVALHSGRWFSAWDHAVSGIERLPTDQDPRWESLAWLVCFGARYALPSEKALATAEVLLSRLANRALEREDWITCGRAHAERATLILVVNYASVFANRLEIDLSACTRSRSEYELSTEAAREMLARSPDASVSRQLDANIISAAALARAFGIAEFLMSEEVVKAARARLLDGIPLTPVLAAEVAVACGDQMPVIPNDDRTLTELDRLEFKAFADYFAMAASERQSADENIA